MQCKRCNKLISRDSITGFCRTCNQRERRIRKNEKYKKLKLCLNCGKKINPKIVYPDGIKGIKIVTYPVKCYNCRIKYK